jgi:hypothetical protein
MPGFHHVVGISAPKRFGDDVARVVLGRSSLPGHIEQRAFNLEMPSPYLQIPHKLKNTRHDKDGRQRERKTLETAV